MGGNVRFRTRFLLQRQKKQGSLPFSVRGLSSYPMSVLQDIQGVISHLC